MNSRELHGENIVCLTLKLVLNNNFMVCKSHKNWLYVQIEYNKKRGSHSNFYSYKINKKFQSSYHSSNDVIYGWWNVHMWICQLSIYNCAHSMGF